MRTETDPIDAVLRDDPAPEDLLGVAATVHDLRAAYLPTGPLHRSPELAAFADPHLAHVDHAGRAASHGGMRNRMLSRVSGFVGTVTGKVVLGTAVAAASVGSLHAANVVDAPGLPDQDRDRSDVAEDAGRDSGDERADAAEGAGDGQGTSAENRAAAEAYTAAVQDWTDCVAAAASAQGEAETRTTAGFDPRESCGEHPAPADYGLTDLPDQAADAAQEAVDGTPGSAAPEDPGAARPTDPSGDAPADPPEDPSSERPAPGTEIPNEAADQAVDPPAPDPEAAGAPETPSSGRP